MYFSGLELEKKERDRAKNNAPGVDKIYNLAFKKKKGTRRKAAHSRK